MVDCPQCGKKLQVRFHYFWGLAMFCPNQECDEYDSVMDIAAFVGSWTTKQITDAMLEVAQKMLDEVKVDEAETT